MPQLNQPPLETLEKYSGEWIAFIPETTEVIAHDEDYLAMVQDADKTKKNFVIRYVHPYDIPQKVKLYPIRFQLLKSTFWQPLYPVTISSKQKRNLSMLVDSGADYSLISKRAGIDLGLELSPNEHVNNALGIGGSVPFVLRDLELTIDDYTFTAPVAWIQNDEAVDPILGREGVFDLFDITFRQAEKKIVFQKPE